MRAHFVQQVGVLAGLLVVGLLFGLAYAGDHTSAAETNQAPPESECGTRVLGVSASTNVRLCDPATVTVGVAAECAEQRVHVVFALIDHSQTAHRWGQFVGPATLDAVAAVPGVDLRAGFVELGEYDTGRIIDLTTDLADLREVLRRVPSHAGTYFYSANVVREVFAMLERGRGDPSLDGIPPIEVVVFSTATKGSASDSASIVEREIRLAGRWFRDFDLDVWMVACSETGCGGCVIDCTPLKKIAPSGRFYTEPPDTEKMPRVVSEEVARLVAGSIPMTLTLEHRLPDGLAYIEDSADVPPDRVDGPPGAQRLLWERTGLAAGLPLTVTYQVMPRALGAWSIDTTSTLTDSLGAASTTIGAVGPITVTDPCIEPTNTPPPPSPTPTLPPPTATPTPTATLAPLVPVFLPVALREPACTPDWQRVDVALVLDASTSMNELTAAGRPKLSAASDAARAFLAALRLDSGDQAAIVSFNAEATLLQTLTSSEPDLHAALDRIATSPQTRIHRGIEVAAAELASPRRATGHTPVIVLLTDGRANPDGPEFAVAEADAAKRAGVTVFTVGLGDDLDHEALRAMASRPEDYHHAPDAEQLAEIYHAIAVTIPCPAERFWGRR